MELLWAPLLAVACLDRHGRPLAFLLACKWGLNYAAFLFLAEWLPVLVDLTAGVLIVAWATPLRGARFAIVTACAVLTMLVHAAYWIGWDSSDTRGSMFYYFSVIALFTAQASALAFPKVKDGVRLLFGWLAGLGRGRISCIHGKTPARRADPAR